MRERQRCRLASIEGRYGVMWVIDASVGCALGVWAGAVGIVPSDGKRRAALVGRLGVLSLPVIPTR
jgi:hypothetical protein